jgi:hypothetical protein
VDLVASRAIIGTKSEAKGSRATRKASGLRIRCFTIRLLSLYTEQAPEELLSQKRRTNKKSVLDDRKMVGATRPEHYWQETQQQISSGKSIVKYIDMSTRLYESGQGW